MSCWTNWRLPGCGAAVAGLGAAGCRPAVGPWGGSGWAVGAWLGAIGRFVVVGGRGVREFGHGGADDRVLTGVAAQLGRRQQERRPELLAARGQNMPAHLVQDGSGRAEKALQLFLDLFQLALDRPLKVEDLGINAHAWWESGKGVMKRRDAG